MKSLRLMPMTHGKEKPMTAPGLNFCVYVQATKDDLCLFEVCKRMMEEGVNDFFFSIPNFKIIRNLIFFAQRRSFAPMGEPTH